MTTTATTLLERLRRPDDQEAWRRFAHLYTPLLYYWARHAGLQLEDAADLVQEVLLLLLREIPRFSYDPSRRFRSWLRTVTLNKLCDRQRALGNRTLPQNQDDLRTVSVPDAADLLAEEDYRQHLIRRALQVMRADFAESTWRACWEQVVEGRAAAEVAGNLGLTVGAVYAARFRVLGRLREELSGLLE